MPEKIVTLPFFMPAVLYLRVLLTGFLRRNVLWGGVLLIIFVVLALFTDDAVYVAVILFFAAIPAGMFYFFVENLTRPASRRLLREQTATIDAGGIELCDAMGNVCRYRWSSVVDCSRKRNYYLLPLRGVDAPFLYLPGEAFADKETSLAFEKIVIAALKS